MEESHRREDSLFDWDERRFTVRFRGSMGGFAEPGNSGMVADLHDYHRPNQRVGRGNTHSNACYSAAGDPPAMAFRRVRKRNLATVSCQRNDRKTDLQTDQ